MNQELAPAHVVERTAKFAHQENDVIENTVYIMPNNYIAYIEVTHYILLQ